MATTARAVLPQTAPPRLSLPRPSNLTYSHLPDYIWRKVHNKVGNKGYFIRKSPSIVCLPFSARWAGDRSSRRGSAYRCRCAWVGCRGNAHRPPRGSRGHRQRVLSVCFGGFRRGNTGQDMTRCHGICRCLEHVYCSLVEVWCGMETAPP